MGNKIVLSNQLFVPSRLVPDSYLRRFHYEWEDINYSYEENEYGDLKKDAYDQPIRKKTKETKILKTYRETFFTQDGEGEPVIALPRGNLQKLQPMLDLGYEDQRPISPLGFKLKMAPHVIGDHRWPDQRRCASTWLRKGYGIVKGDTGSGKTIVGMAVTCGLGMNTLIMSKRRDGNEHWEDEIRQHTNINELEEKFGRKLLGVYKAARKVRRFPITIATVQSFSSRKSTKGRQFIKDNRDYFGLLLLDEVHEFGAPKFAGVVQEINPYAILGLTATPKRDDNRHHIVLDIAGPVVATGTAKQMPPEVHFIQTGVQSPEWLEQKNYPRHYKWKKCMETIADDEGRYETILKYIRKDAADGRFIACISPERKKIAKKLGRILAKEGYSVEVSTGDTPPKVRKEIYARVKRKETQILCAGKVLNALVSLPSIDALHFLTPAKSQAATKQVYGRARRWLANKRNPIIRDYVDEGGQFDGGYKNRVALCKAEGWTVRRVDREVTKALGLGIWKKRHEA